MRPERPDLSGVDAKILAYIEALEAELGKRVPSMPRAEVLDTSEPPNPTEPPTSLNLITASLGGAIKRTPRHLYNRQRRGGMGIFDLEISGDDVPALLTVADQSKSLLIFTNLARVFRLPAGKLEESGVRARGELLTERLQFEPDERPVVILPDQASGYLAMVSQNGFVRSLRHHLFGEYLKPGTSFFNLRETGPLAAACWTNGDADLFIATRGGMAIRFSEKSVPPKGEFGIRVAAGDSVVGITWVEDDSGVFLATSEGRGTTRLMSGFAPNKSPGGGGKIAIKADTVIGAASVTGDDDIFIISRLSKLIRFNAGEVPTTEGVVQGVICMSLRSDEAVAMVRAQPAGSSS